MSHTYQDRINTSILGTIMNGEMVNGLFAYRRILTRGYFWAKKDLFRKRYG